MKILKQTDHEIHVKGEGRILKFWIHGEGLIPLHKNPTLLEDGVYRSKIKDLLFGNAKERRKPIK